MDILFENRYKVTKERYLDWAQYPLRKNYFKYLWGIFSVLLLFILFLYTLERDYYMMIFLILMIVFCLYRGFLRNKLLAAKQFRTLSIIQKAQEWDRIIRFSDNISVIEGNTISKYQWEQIVEIISRKQYLILAFSNRLGIRLDKNCFTQGTYEDFIRYITTIHHIKLTEKK